jgi:adenylate kinase family enzyme
MNKLTLTVIRGHVGSGKSTIAKKMASEQDLAHYETDMFFTTSDGEYKFDFAKLGDAIKWSETMTESALKYGKSVVVTGVFSRLFHMNNMKKIAASTGATFHVIEATGDYGSIHGVPEDAIAGMKARWEPLTDEWLSAP